MSSFGIIAEGATDQLVIENLLLGYFEDGPEEPEVRFIQPPRPLSTAPGGWTHVFNCLKRKDYEGALQFNDYLVVQIDTDVQEEPGFDVPKRAGGRESTVEERVSQVIERLKREIDQAFLNENQAKLLFAISVDSIECWLLPLLYTEKKDAKKAGKTTGCLDAANQKLRTLNQNALGTPEKKFPDAYERASHGFLKRKTLLAVRAKNPSLDLFIHELDALQARIGSISPTPSPITNNADPSRPLDS